MAILKVVLLVATAILIAIGCVRRKTVPENLDSWLDLHFPGRFTVVSTYWADPVAHLSFKVKRSVVAETAQPHQQFEIQWDKRAADLGLTQGQIDTLANAAARAYHSASELHNHLAARGLQEYATGIDGHVLMILIFSEPTAAARMHSLDIIRAAVSTWPGDAFYAVRIAFCDERHPGYNDFYPLAHWAEPGTLQLRPQTCIANIVRDDDGTWQQESPIWNFNTYGDRFETYSANARTAVLRHAADHMLGEITLLPLEEFEPVPSAPLQYVFRFPFIRQQDNIEGSALAESEPDGYLTCIFDTETGQISGIRVENAIPSEHE